MERTFYDQHGQVVAYTQDGQHIYTYPGEPVAYLFEDKVYHYNGVCLGRIHEG